MAFLLHICICGKKGDDNTVIQSSLLFSSFFAEKRKSPLLCNFFQTIYVTTPVIDMFRWNSIVIPILHFVGINVGHIIFITPNTDIDF